MNFIKDTDGNEYAEIDVEKAPFCKCGCREKVKKSQNYKGWNKFISGHNARGKKGIFAPAYGFRHTEEADEEYQFREKWKTHFWD